ncbi:unnamed protein product [Amoebophrya sp. A120]|nr:unnamed protein product [Amoebophrya sp. A120]|eukprot:GSA120T00017830001.1
MLRPAPPMFILVISIMREALDRVRRVARNTGTGSTCALRRRFLCCQSVALFILLHLRVSVSRALPFP